MRKGLWSPDEDEKLMACIAQHQSGSWSDIARNAGLQRCGKSCRRRWMNHLRPDLKQDKFTSDEIRLVTKLHETLGNKWSEIATYLVGRTDNDVKNLWNTHIKRQKRLAQDHASQLNEMIKNSDEMTKNSDVHFPFSIELKNGSMGKSFLENSNYFNITNSTISTITSTTSLDSDQLVCTSHSIDSLDISSFYEEAPNVPLRKCNQLVSFVCDKSNMQNSSFYEERNPILEPNPTTNFEYFFNFNTFGSLMMESNDPYSIEHNESTTSHNYTLEGTCSDESSTTRSILDDGSSVGQSSIFELSYPMEIMQHIVLDFE